jgi:quercetin 2,3-dioxygenase
VPISIIEGKRGDVGGIPVRRLLPRATRRTVGPWCFVDHAGPITSPKMQVGPHPHIGLHTVSWMISGEVVHYDSLGSEQTLTPGQLNVMTAGHGIAHAEQTDVSGNALTANNEQHLVQLWAAQPEDTRHGVPAFIHYSHIPTIDTSTAQVTVMMGAHANVSSEASLHWPASAIDILLRGAYECDVSPEFEYGVVTVNGTVIVNDIETTVNKFVYIPTGHTSLRFIPSTPTAHVVLIGGTPFEEKLAMHWNFVARTTDELHQAVTDWNSDSDRFGSVGGGLSRIPAPAIVRA